MYCVFGAGGHARDLLGQLVERTPDPVVAFVDEIEPGRYVDDVPVISLHEALSKHRRASWLLAVGDGSARSRVAGILRERGIAITSYVSDRAYVARGASIDAGAQIFAGCAISSNVRVGFGVVVGFNCVVSHDCQIDEFATLSPGCTLAGRVAIGARVFVGAGATIAHRRLGRSLTVGSDCVIGVGAVVIEDVPEKMRVAGVPAKPLPTDLA